MSESASVVTKKHFIGCAVVVTALAVFATAVMNGIIIHKLEPGENGGLKDFYICLGGLAVGALVSFGIASRAIGKSLTGTHALILGVLAVATIPVFWMSLPLIFGMPAAHLGWAGLKSAQGRGKSWAALVLGAAAIALQVWTVIWP